MQRPLSARISSLFVLAIPAAFVACLDLNPTVGNRPLTDEERNPPKDGGVTFDAPDEAGRTVYFGRDIRPRINRSATDPDPGCFPCHDGHAAKHVGVDLGGLDMSTLGKLRQGGGTSGSKIVVPGDPAASAIVQKLKGTYPYGTRMPKSGPPFWSDDAIALVEQWIREGAQGDDSE